MKTITEKYKIYKFEELSKEAKDKAMQDWNNQEEYHFLPKDMLYKAEDLLEENKIDGEIENVFYSLNYCQGDGAMIQGSFKWKGYNIEAQQSGMYYHYNSKTLDISDDEDEQASDEVYKEFDALYVEICEELARYGYDVIETAGSEENLKDLFEANDYMFLENGKMYNY